jgi:hypothetical protein
MFHNMHINLLHYINLGLFIVILVTNLNHYKETHSKTTDTLQRFEYVFLIFTVDTHTYVAMYIRCQIYK